MNDEERNSLTINYKGDLTDEKLVDRILGPDEFGAYYAVVEATFNGKDKTAAKLRPVTHEELVGSTFDPSGQRYLPKA